MSIAGTGRLLAVIAIGLGALSPSSARPAAQASRGGAEDRLERAAESVRSATTVGVNYPRFSELLQQFATELNLAKDVDPRVRALLADALRDYKVSSEAWALKIKGRTLVAADRFPPVAGSYDVQQHAGSYVMDELMRAAWKSAAKNVDGARALLASPAATPPAAPAAGNVPCYVATGRDALTRLRAADCSIAIGFEGGTNTRVIVRSDRDGRPLVTIQSDAGSPPRMWEVLWLDGAPVVRAVQKTGPSR